MTTPANDAHLVQLVRGALGRDPRTRSLPRVNVSSCKLVVTLHGSLTAEQGRAVREVVSGVDGVEGIVCKL
ncbi:BON domain-containing protein [Rubrobacter aplysinae]|uniref:BON domain-containing protein n=1 Tax=Rubrobacter aplysinae TaxID=909625 RepID=UPI00064C1134|nr:BON domain-containing protein [Rubrobacter aplysinae]